MFCHALQCFAVRLKELENKGSKSTERRDSDGVVGSTGGRGRRLRIRTSGSSRGRAGLGAAILGGANGNRGRNRGSLALVRVTTDHRVFLQGVPGRAVEVLRRRVNVDTTLDNGQRGKSSIVERTNKVNGTSDLRDLGETKNGLELTVVGNLETTANLGKNGERDVGQLGVGDNGKRAANVLKLGARNRLHGVVGEGKSRVDGSHVGQSHRGDVTEGNVVGPGEVREGDNNVRASGRELENVGNIVEVKVELGEVLVVVDVEGLNGLEGDSVKGGDGGIRNDEGLGAGDSSIELECVEVVERDEGDVASRFELGEGDNVEGLEDLKGKGTRDVCQDRGSEGGEGGDVLDNQVTIEDLDTTDSGGGNGAVKGNVTLEGGARGDSVEVRLRGDREVGGADRRGCGEGTGGGQGQWQGFEEHVLGFY